MLFLANGGGHFLINLTKTLTNFSTFPLVWKRLGPVLGTCQVIAESPISFRASSDSVEAVSS